MVTEEKNESLQIEEEMTGKGIFREIWLSPRSMFKYINDNEYDKYVRILLVLAGISQTLARASSRGMGDDMSLIGVL